MPDALGVHYKFRHVARVTFFSCFPMDMLRYDRCHPYRSGDVARITASLTNPKMEQVEVEVVAYANTRTAPWTVDRWNSFGCSLEVK